MAAHLLQGAFAADRDSDSEEAVPTSCAVASAATAVEETAPEQTMSQQSDAAAKAVEPAMQVTPIKKEEKECCDRL